MFDKDKTRYGIQLLVWLVSGLEACAKGLGFDPCYCLFFF